MDVFGAFLLDIDFPAQQLSLQPLPQRPSDNTGKLALQTSGEEWKLDDDPASGKADPGPQEKSSPPIAHEPRDRYIAPEMVNYTPIYHFGHLMLIPTKVGDESQNLFVLDTGSSMSPLSLTTAKGIVNFLVPSSVGIRGMSGSVANVFDVGDVTLQIGNLKEENKQAFAFDLSHLSNEVGTEVSGILGINLLRQLAVRIDYRDGLVDFRQKQQ
jgi:hypothetical protein